MSQVEEQQNVVVEDNGPRLKYFPIMMFAVVMGFSGVTIAYKKASEVLGLAPIIYQVLSYTTAALAVIIGLIYLLKLIKFPKAIKKEFGHPVRVNFFAALSISLLLLAVVFHEFTSVSRILFIIGAGTQLFFTFYAITYWLNKNIEVGHSNPAWFIPVVGNLIVPIAGEGFADPFVLNFFFSLGGFFWIILTAILMNRIIFHGMLPQKFAPTLAIFIAPPSVGMLSYVKLNSISGIVSLDGVSIGLLHIGLVFFIILLALAKNFYKIKFFVSWWAFTFPLGALTTAFLVGYQGSSYLPYKIAGIFMLGFTTIVILLIIFRTIVAIRNGEICKPE